MLIFLELAFLPSPLSLSVFLFNMQSHFLFLRKISDKFGNGSQHLASSTALHNSKVTEQLVNWFNYLGVPLKCIDSQQLYSIAQFSCMQGYTKEKASMDNVFGYFYLPKQL